MLLVVRSCNKIVGPVVTHRVDLNKMTVASLVCVLCTHYRMHTSIYLTGIYRHVEGAPQHVRGIYPMEGTHS